MLHKDRLRHEAMLESMECKLQISTKTRRKAAMLIASEPSPSFTQQTTGSKTHVEDNMHAMAKPSSCLRPINATQSINTTNNLEMEEQGSAGPAENRPWKPEHLCLEPEVDLFSLPRLRDRRHNVKTTYQEKLPDLLKYETSKKISLTIHEGVDPQLRANIANVVLDCINSAQFKNRLAVGIIGESHAKLAKIISQVHDQEHTMKFDTKIDYVKNTTSQEQMFNNRNFLPDISDGVASVIANALIELKEVVKKTFRSHSDKFHTASPTVYDTVIEMVDRVFETMLDFLNPKYDASIDRDSRMRDALASHLFESILHSTGSDTVPSMSQDETLKFITAHDIEILDIVKKGFDSPKTSTSSLLTKGSHQFSGPELQPKADDEDNSATSGTENIYSGSRSDETAKDGMLG